MAKITFTKGFLDSAAPGEYTDAGCKGLCLRVTANDIKTFTMRFRSRITGKPENKTIGHYPAVPLAGPGGARTLVNDAWKLVEASQPVAFSTVKKNEGGLTVDEALALYKQRKLGGMRSGTQDHSYLSMVVTEQKWGNTPIAALEKKHLMEAFYAIRDRGSVKSAGRAQQLFSTFMKWCAIHDHIPHNPIAGMPNVGGKTTRRTRTLRPDEVRKLWQVCHNPAAYQLPQIYADALLLILTTSARPGMIAGLTVEELYGFAQRPAAERRNTGPLADFPAERMKKGRDFVLPLNDLAQDIILRRLDQTTGSNLFMSQCNRVECKEMVMPVDRLAQACRDLCEVLGWTKEGQGVGSPFTPHDLRRTASKMLREFFTRDEVGQLLSHETEGSETMKHYDPEDRWDNLVGPRGKRAMSDKLAELICEVTATRLSVVESQRAA